MVLSKVDKCPIMTIAISMQMSWNMVVAFVKRVVLANTKQKCHVVKMDIV